MNVALKLASLVTSFSLASSIALASGAEAPKDQPSADQIIQQLREGNDRFVRNESTFPHLDNDRRCDVFHGGQHPLVTVLSCSDSRVPPEYLFDAGIGDLFVIRVAGNVADTDEIGTAEYGAGHLNTPVILVMGHTKCGAVTAVVDGHAADLPGSLPKLVDNIDPAAALARDNFGHLPKDKLVNHAIRLNVRQSMADLLTRSDSLRKLVQSGKVKLVGAVYDIHDGRVEFLGEHPAQEKLLAGKSVGDEELLQDLPTLSPRTLEHNPPAKADSHADDKDDHGAKDDHKHDAKDDHGTKPAAKSKSAHDDDHDEKPAKKTASKKVDAHDDHDSTDAHAKADAHDDHGQDAHATDEHGEDAGKDEKSASAISKQGLILPIAFGLGSAALSGGLVFFLKGRGNAPVKPAAASEAKH
jgi:carbonic anhydrase